MFLRLRPVTGSQRSIGVIARQRAMARKAIAYAESYSVALVINARAAQGLDLACGQAGLLYFGDKNRSALSRLAGGWP